MKQPQPAYMLRHWRPLKLKRAVLKPRRKLSPVWTRQGRVSPAPVRVELAYKQFVQARLLHNAIKWQHVRAFANRFRQDFALLQEKTICHWSPARRKLFARENPFHRFKARLGTVAGENLLPWGTSTTLNWCRGEHVFNGPQQDLAPLHERTLSHRSPAQP